MKEKDPFFISVFLQEIIFQCKCIKDCFKELQNSLKEVRKHENNFRKSLAQNIFGKESMREVLNLLNSDDEKVREALINEGRENADEELLIIAQFNVQNTSRK